MNGRIDAHFPDPESFVRGLKVLREAGIRGFEAYAPATLVAVEDLLPRPGSPVRFITFGGAVCGCLVAFGLCIVTALNYNLVVGGKLPAQIMGYFVPAFELTILFGGLATIAAVVLLCKTNPFAATPPGYFPGVCNNKFSVSVPLPEGAPAIDDLLREAGAEEIRYAARSR